jgi:cell division protein FtsZ
LGESGLGAGANPEVARKFALESRDDIIKFIGPETKMLFITAGLGKGTGTGAAPVVAEIAKEMDILTIAVVTLPFKFEGTISSQFAEAGVAELRKHVDSLIMIKNQNIIKHYNDEELDRAFGYADDVLKNAVKCIAELITINLEQNIDFNDINSIMKQSGAAMLGIAEASGENRIDEVIEGALRCPLLTEEHISNARNFLFSISYGSEKKLRIREFEKLTDKFEELKSKNSHVIWGRSEDPTLGDKIKLSVIISKYNTEMVEINTVRDAQEIYESDKQKGAQEIHKRNTYHSPSSPANMEPEIKEQPPIVNKENNPFAFLNENRSYNSQRTFVPEPEAVTPYMDYTSQSDGPHHLRSTYDPRYENNHEFAFLIDTPAIQRMRQEDKEGFQDKAVIHNQAPSFRTDEDLHDFFRSLPD